MSTSGKDTIYIDIDDEITTIIDKVRSSNDKILALVLPKRATVLQSIVNMKLLKRAADSERKHLVLITSELGLLPLAGTVGLYVAKTLQTKPEIPGGMPQEDDSEFTEDMNDDAGADEITAANAGNRPVGELASPAAAVAGTEGIETLELDDDDDNLAAEMAADTPLADSKKSKKPKKNKKLAIPNFERFRILLVLGVLLLIGLIVFGYFATAVLPKASIVITTDTSSINSNLALSVDTAAKTFDAKKPTLPAQTQKVDKTGSQQVPASGKQNNGQKSSGSVTMTAQECGSPQPANDVPAGTGVTSNGLTYITQQNTTFSVKNIKSGCINFTADGATPVIAQTGGANYNIAATSFTVAGRSDVAASSSAQFTGGTDNNVQIVAQSDIDTATQKIAAQNADSIKQALEQQLKQAGEYPLATTFVAGTPAVTSSAKAGDQVSTVTVTQTTTYTMLGVKESDLKTLVDNDIKDKIDPSKQSILSEGLDKATYKVNSANNTSAQIAFSTTATAGPDLKVDELKKTLASQKSGQIITTLKADPGVTDVKVKFSPFWVSSVPNKPAKVTITFQKAN